MRRLAGIMAVTTGLAWSPGAVAQNNDADLAKKLANPVSSLISVPFQNNYECCYGPSDAYRYTLNIQPVVPVSINDDWNMISRTILPIVYQEETAPGVGDHFGVSDITQSLFFSPKAQRNGVTWAVGPVFLIPIGDENLGSQKWGAGPTALVLKQTGPVTVGVLANHIWSFAGDADRDDINQTFVQPFYTYTHPDSTAVSFNSEASYNWKSQQWTVPVNMGVSHLYRFGGQRVQLAGTYRYYLTRDRQGPEWGFRFTATFLFPE